MLIIHQSRRATLSLEVKWINVTIVFYRYVFRRKIHSLKAIKCCLRSFNLWYIMHPVFRVAMCLSVMWVSNILHRPIGRWLHSQCVFSCRLSHCEAPNVHFCQSVLRICPSTNSAVFFGSLSRCRFQTKPRMFPNLVSARKYFYFLKKAFRIPVITNCENGR